VREMATGLIGSLVPAAWLALAIQTRAGQAREGQRSSCLVQVSQS